MNPGAVFCAMRDQLPSPSFSYREIRFQHLRRCLPGNQTSTTGCLGRGYVDNSARGPVSHLEYELAPCRYSSKSLKRILRSATIALILSKPTKVTVMHTYTVQRALCLLAVIAMAICVTGCGEREPEVSDEPPPPPPPTPKEIADKIITDLQLNEPLPAPGATMSKQASGNFLSAVKSAKTRNSASQDGKQALQFVSQKLDSRLRALEDNQLWEHVLTYCDAHLVLNPDSHKFDRTREKAVAELKKPRVTIAGFFYDENTAQTSVFMDFYVPTDKESHREHVRVGEEFYGLKLVAIIGNNQGVTMEYLETGQAFDILKDSANR